MVHAINPDDKWRHPPGITDPLVTLSCLSFLQFYHELTVTEPANTRLHLKFQEIREGSS